VVVDLLYELSDVLVGLLEVLVILQINFLHFQCSEEALGLGVLVGVAHSGHADLCAGLLKPCDILA
jgi:hypothetical protein